MKKCYSIADVCELLQIPRSTFFHLRAIGKLPMLEELRPRLGSRPRYRADLVDRWLDGQHGQPRAFRTMAS